MSAAAHAADPSARGAARRWPDHMTSWLRAPAWRPLGYLTAIVLCMVPRWLFWDELANPRLRGDDFAFLAASRGGAEPLGDLFEPHNAHVVPLFRLLTAALARCAGTLANASDAFFLANYAALAALMLAIGHLVAWETRRMTAGLAAMAFLGITSVIFTAGTWYSAGQTLRAALLAAGALVLAQSWRRKPTITRMAATALCALSAPFFWGGGLVAGCAAAAYLWRPANPRARRAAIVLVTVSLLAASITVAFGWQSMAGADNGPAVAFWQRPPRALLLTCQAMTEALVFQNLGVDAYTTPQQGLLFVVALTATWRWSRGKGMRINTLEAPGLVLIVLPYLMAFFLRAGFGFESLRSLGWYNTMPQVGAVLFAAGWLSDRIIGPPAPPAPASRGGLLGVALVAAVLFGLHAPRVERLLIENAPPMSEFAQRKMPTPPLRRLRAVYYLSEEAARQYRALQRLKRVEQIAAGARLSRATLRKRLGPFPMPGWPPAINDLDALDLVKLSENGGPAPALGAFVELRSLFEPEPIRWLDVDRPDTTTPPEPEPPRTR